MKHNAMLKSEYDVKMKKLQDTWLEVNREMTSDKIPGTEELEQMVGLVQSKAKVKSMHEMLKEQTKD